MLHKINEDQQIMYIVPKRIKRKILRTQDKQIIDNQMTWKISEFLNHLL